MKKLIFLFMFVIVQFANSQWEKCTNLESKYIYTLVSVKNNIFTGTRSDGIFLSTDDGESWILKKTGLTNDTILSMSIDESKVFAGTYKGGIFLSTDNGEQWIQKNNGLKDTVIFSILIDGSDIYAGTSNKGLQLSTDCGENWIYFDNEFSQSSVVGIVSADNKIIVISGGQFGSLCYSSDGCNSWNLIAGFDNFIYSLAKNGTNIYSGTDNFGIYLSSDNGNHWIVKNYEDIVHEFGIYSFAFYGNNIFLGTNHGVYLSKDECSSLIQMNDGLTDTIVRTLTISGEYIFAGTWGGGVYRSKLSDLTSVNEEAFISDKCFSISPNPAKDYITVSIQNNRVNYKIEIYNLLGNKFQEFLTENNRANINIESLPKGIYFVRIGSETKMFVKE